MFADRTWAESLPGAKLLVYAPRMTRFGKVPKVNALFEGAEADFVILPARTLWAAKLLVSLGFHRREGFLRRGLRDLSIVIRPGWRFLKGSEKWDAFYRRVVAEVDDARLGDAAAVNLANTFVCDYIWTVRKVDRGELIAAQRMLHRELAETNLRLLHELRLRRGERSYPEGRRIEQLTAGPGMPGIAPNARCDGPRRPQRPPSLGSSWLHWWARRGGGPDRWNRESRAAGRKERDAQVVGKWARGRPAPLIDLRFPRTNSL